MSDLVERLRERARQLRHDVIIDGIFPDKKMGLYEEAADEIERLKNDLANLALGLTGDDHYTLCARRALGMPSTKELHAMRREESDE
jgi:hypothetical protein